MRFGEELSTPEHGLSDEQQWIAVRLDELGGAVQKEQTKFKIHRKAEERGLKAPSAWMKVDLEVVYRDKELEQAVVKELVKLILERVRKDESFEFDLVAGVPSGATRLAIGVAEQVSFILDEKVILPLEITKRDDGSFYVPPLQESQKSKRVVMVEDVMTTGASTAAAADVLRAAGYEVVFAVALVNREQGGPERLGNIKIPSQAAFTFKQLVQFYRQERIIKTKEEYDRILQGEDDIERFRKDHNF